MLKRNKAAPGFLNQREHLLYLTSNLVNQESVGWVGVSVLHLSQKLIHFSLGICLAFDPRKCNVEFEVVWMSIFWLNVVYCDTFTTVRDAACEMA